MAITEQFQVSDIDSPHDPGWSSAPDSARLHFRRERANGMGIRNVDSTPNLDKPNLRLKFWQQSALG